jgi:hypothetical protein
MTKRDAIIRRIVTRLVKSTRTLKRRGKGYAAHRLRVRAEIMRQLAN